MYSLNRRTFLAAAGSAALPLAGHSAPQFPSRPIRMVIPFAPGGTVDPIARMVADVLAKRLGGTVFCENKPGANGLVAADAIMGSPMDGYHLLYAGSSMYEKMFTLKKTFDPFKNFQLIARIVEVPLVFAISSAIPAKTLPEFIDYAKRKGDFSAGSWGVGSGGHLQTAELASQAQLKFVHAVYKGEGPILLDVMAGLVDGGFFSVSAAMAQAATGKLTLLAVTGAQRHPLAPDVPTFAESGFKGFDSSTWHGVFYGKGVPADIASLVANHIVEGMGQKDIVSKVEKMGITPALLAGEPLQKFLAKNYENLEVAMRKFNIEPQ